MAYVLIPEFVARCPNFYIGPESQGLDVRVLERNLSNEDLSSNLRVVWSLFRFVVNSCVIVSLP